MSKYAALAVSRQFRFCAGFSDSDNAGAVPRLDGRRRTIGTRASPGRGSITRPVNIASGKGYRGIIMLQACLRPDVVTLWVEAQNQTLYGFWPTRCEGALVPPLWRR